MSATPEAPGLVVLGPDTTKVGERHTGVVDTFKVAEKHASCGALSGRGGPRPVHPDEGRSASADTVLGLVGFKKVPNYEGPDDHDHDREYELEIVARKGAERSAPHSFVVVVENRRDPGFITLAPPRPRPGQTFLATLADEDGGVDSLEWEWTGGRSVIQGGQAPSLHASGREARPADVGKQIRVTASYRDNYGRDSAMAVTDTILDVPEAPPDFKASPGDRQVTLTWGEAANGGDPITHYETRYRRSDRQWSDTWSQVGGGAGARTRTISPLTNGQQYVFQVRAENGIGDGAAADTLATPVDPRPQILGPDTTRVGEGRHAGVVATFKVADTGRSVTWESLAGLDGAKFTLTRQVGVDTVLGLVEFKKARTTKRPTTTTTTASTR